MENCTITSPLGYTKVIGDEDGISSVTVLNSEETITDIIPEALQDCVYQLNEYFEGTRKQFSLKLNPKGTDFQQNIWRLLQTIPYGKSISYLNLSKRFANRQINGFQFFFRNIIQIIT